MYDMKQTKGISRMSRTIQEIVPASTFQLLQTHHVFKHMMLTADCSSTGTLKPNNLHVSGQELFLSFCDCFAHKKNFFICPEKMFPHLYLYRANLCSPLSFLDNLTSCTDRAEKNLNSSK